MAANASKTVEVFRIETAVPCFGSTPWEKRIYEFPNLRNGQTWTLRAHRDLRNDQRLDCFDYVVDVKPPAFLATSSEWTYRIYERTTALDLTFNDKAKIDAITGWLQKPRHAPQAFIGVEVTLTTLRRRKWNFQDEGQMNDPDVQLLFGDTKFFAHKRVLSLVSPVFDKMFHGEFREKHAKQVDVSADGILPSEFEEFLHSLYPCCNERPDEQFLVPLTILADYYGVETLFEKCRELLAGSESVSKADKLKVAIAVSDAELEGLVVDSMTKDDIRALFTTDMKHQLGEERLIKLMEKVLQM